MLGPGLDYKGWRNHLEAPMFYCGLLILLLFPTLACQGPSDGQLAVVFPTESTELAGGQLLRVTVSLADHEGQPIEGATVQNGQFLRITSSDIEVKQRQPQRHAV